VSTAPGITTTSDRPRDPPPRLAYRPVATIPMHLFPVTTSSPFAARRAANAHPVGYSARFLPFGRD
jgi:hypothetical protein